LGELATNIPTFKLLNPPDWAYMSMARWLWARIKQYPVISKTKDRDDAGYRVDDSESVPDQENYEIKAEWRRVFDQDREFWERTMAIVACYLPLRSLCPLPGDARVEGEEGRGDDAGLDEWFEIMMARWWGGNGEELVVTWELSREVLRKLDEWRGHVVATMLTPRWQRSLGREKGKGRARSAAELRGAS